MRVSLVKVEGSTYAVGKIYTTGNYNCVETNTFRTQKLSESQQIVIINLSDCNKVS